MDKFSDLLDDKSLHEVGTGWCDVIGHQFDFMTSSITYSRVTLKIDGVLELK